MGSDHADVRYAIARAATEEVLDLLREERVEIPSDLEWVLLRHLEQSDELAHIIDNAFKERR